MFSLNDLKNLKAFAKIIAGFPVPPDLVKLAKEIGLTKKQIIIQDARTLRDNLLAPNWQQDIFLNDTPSNSQLFARMLIMAGFDGIRYKSSKGKHDCIAVFPEAIKDTDSFVETSDSVPECVENKRLDGSTYLSFI